MAIYKNDNGTWYVMIRYQDWTGARKQKCKRGFSTRKEAVDWELQFKLQKKASVDMTMESLLNGDGKGQKSRKAKEFLLEILADGGMSQKKILEEAAKRGIKGKTLRNAKSELEVDSIKRGNQWYWVLPE